MIVRSRSVATTETGLDPGAPAVSLPSRRVSPLAAAAFRMALAVLLVVLATVIVYLGRNGYRDTAHPGQPLTLLSSAYYATVTLSTIGW